jgi:hypothetical protein
MNSIKDMPTTENRKSAMTRRYTSWPSDVSQHCNKIAGGLSMGKCGCRRGKQIKDSI